MKIRSLKYNMILVCSVLTLSQPISSQASCNTDAQCDDGLFCNGLELCRPEDPLSDGNGCVRRIEPRGVNHGYTGPFVRGTICREDNNEYTTGYCDEADAACRQRGEDVDGDGHASIRSGGDDCDDTDANRYPGNIEICDPAGKDEDCNPMTVGRKDSDGDGYTDSSCYNIGPDGKRIFDRMRH